MCEKPESDLNYGESGVKIIFNLANLDRGFSVHPRSILTSGYLIISIKNNILRDIIQNSSVAGGVAAKP